TLRDALPAPARSDSPASAPRIRPRASHLIGGPDHPDLVGSTHEPEIVAAHQVLVPQISGPDRHRPKRRRLWRARARRRDGATRAYRARQSRPADRRRTRPREQPTATQLIPLLLIHHSLPFGPAVAAGHAHRRGRRSAAAALRPVSL